MPFSLCLYHPLLFLSSTASGVFSSSSSAFNGQKRILLGFSLSGAATATLRGESRGARLQLVSLQVSAAGQVIDVPLEEGVRAGGGGNGSGGGRNDEVIDVESW